MWTLSKNEYREKLAETMKRLGVKTSYCYVLVDATLPNFPIYFCNEAYCNLTGYVAEELVGTPYNQFFTYLKRDEYKEVEETIRSGEIARFEIFHSRKDGHFFQAQVECFPLLNEDMQTEFIFVMVTDITYKVLIKQGNDLERRMFRAIERENTLFEKLTLTCEFIDNTLGPEVFSTIVMKVEDQLYISSTLPFEDSYTHQIPKGMAHNYYKYLMQLEDSKVFTRHKGYALSKMHQQYALDHGQHSCWQIPIPIHTGEIIGVITIFFKVQRRPREFYNRIITKIITLIGLAYNYEMKQQQIYRLAYTDLSTGLPNRHDFLRKIDENKEGVIIFIQPSEFSKFVELYGRHFGDEMLKQLSNKISRLQEIDLVGQFSSSMLALHIMSEQEANRNLIRLFDRITKEPLNIFGNNIYISLKIGVARCAPNISAEITCRNAESALSVAKTKTGTKIEYYNNQMQEKLKKELIILNELVEAIQNNEFKVYVQPKIELHRGRIYGMEALARWISPKLGFVSPADFIPIAENAGLIREIDLQIIEQVLIWMQERQYQGKKIAPVAVNISPEHFYHPKFISGLRQLVQKYYADPKYLIIEVTESISLVDIEKAKEILVRLRLMGFGTSVDDFGIGYSSLTYLQKLFFSELKIDQSFISKIHEVGTNSIVKSILQIAHHLSMTSVAEGIETEEQYELLKKLGCNVAQGYYFYKPMPLEELDEKAII